MKRLMLLIIAVALFILVQQVSADVTIVNTVTSTVDGKEQSSGDNTAYYKADRVRMEVQTGMVSIIRLDKGVMWILKTEEKTYMEITPEQLKDLSARMKGEAKFDVEKTDETKEINKYNCTKVVIKTQMMGIPSTTEIWATKEIKPDETLLKFMKKAEEVFKDDPNMKSSTQMMQTVFDMNSYPVQMTTSLKMMGKEIKNQTTLKSIETGNIEDSLFELPEDYKLEAAPTMPKMNDLKNKIKVKDKIKDKIK
jgi:hypothetical protein